MHAIRRGWFHELCGTQLERLWGAVHGRPPPRQVLHVVDLLVPRGLERPAWPSYVSDDHTPYELSLLIGDDGAEVRLMAEPMPTSGPVTLASTIAAGLGLRPALEELGADFTRLDRIADLFLPDSPSGAFALWLAASFSADGKPAFKAYLNPAIQGRHEAPRLVEEALERLGVRGGWATVCRAMTRGPALDELRFFSIDLAPTEAARVKVYGFHHDATVDVLARAVAQVPGADLPAVRRFCRTLLAGEGALVAERQPATCLAFVGNDALPKTGTVHVPIRTFAGDDATAQARVACAIRELGLSPRAFEAATAALAQRPLEEGSGVVAWAAVRTGGDRPKANVYLAPKALVDEPTRAAVAPRRRTDDPEAVVRRFDEETIAAHPFFRRLAREPFDERPLALLVFNIREAITLHFARRLANVVARVEEDPIRSILVKQLNDELGDGDPSRTHKILFERFAAGFARRVEGTLGEDSLGPGRAFGSVQDELYLSRSAYEGLGATLVMELLGKQADLTMGKLLRRSETPLPAPVMEWLTLHEELEIAHVDESYELARMIPSGRKAELAVRGAEELGHAGWAFLDDMYSVCFAAA